MASSSTLAGILDFPTDKGAKKAASRGLAGDLAGAGDMSVHSSGVDLGTSMSGAKEDPTSTTRSDGDREGLKYVHPSGTTVSSATADVANTAAAAGGRGFAGLANQGATCYMNSLLQALFMTPEFRRLIYSWVYDEEVEGGEGDCIPFQLQKLFGGLQITTRRALSTRALTKSFQWTSADAFQQHDVQELMRVLLDALERSLRASGHPTPTAVNDLFKGRFVDYIRTANAADFERFGEEAPVGDADEDGEMVKDGLSTLPIARQREDPFMDMSLVIRPFGATKAVGSVEESLSRFINPELIHGANRVEFEELGGAKVPVVKGLKIASPPYLLTLQLKRFDLDFTSPTLARIKLNDKVTFPELLNLNLWVDTESPPPIPEAKEEEEETIEGGGAAESAVPPSGSSSAIVPWQGEEGAAAPQEPDTEGTADPESGAGGAGTAADPPAAGASATGAATAPAPAPVAEPEESYEEFKERGHAMAVEHGPFVYELYAVLVHSGGASGGHYYVYIKDLESGQWRNFNDSSVTNMTLGAVKEAYGGASKYSTYTSSANAYMLMYRRMTFDDVPLPEDQMPPADETPAQPTEAAAEGAGEEGGEAAHVAAAFSVSRYDLLTGKAATFPGSEVLPAAVKDAVDAEVAAELEADLARARAANSIKLLIQFNGTELAMPIQRSDTVQEATRRAWELFDLAPKTPPAGKVEEEVAEEGVKVPLDCVRIREWKAHGGHMGAPFGGEDLPKTVSEIGWYSHQKLALEVKEPSAEFEVYDPSAIYVKVRLFRALDQSFSDPVSLPVRRTGSLASVKRSIEAHPALGVPAERQRVIKMSHYGNHANKTFTIRALVGDEWQVTSGFYIHGSSDLYVEDVAELEAMVGAYDPFADGSKTAEAAADPASTRPDHVIAATGVGAGGVSTKLPAVGGASRPPQVWVSASREAVLAVPAEGKAGVPGLREGMISITESTSPAVALYKQQAFLIKVRYTEVDKREEVGSFTMDMRLTVGQLRARLAEVAGVSTEHLLLEKVHPHQIHGISMRDDKIALEDMYFNDGTLVRLVSGERVAPGEVRVRFTQYTGPFPPGTGWVDGEEEPLTGEDVPDHLHGWVSRGGWALKPLAPEEEAVVAASNAVEEEVEATADAAPVGEDSKAAEGEATADAAPAGEDSKAAEGEATADAAPAGEGGEDDAAGAAEAVAKVWAVSSDPYPSTTDVTLDTFATMPVSKEDDLSVVKAKVVGRLIELGKVPAGTDPGCLRIRQKPSTRCTRIVPDGGPLKAVFPHMWENQELFVEVLPSAEQHFTGKAKREAAAAVAEVEAVEAGGDEARPPPTSTSTLKDAEGDDIVLVVRWFDTARYKLTAPREMRVVKGASVAEVVMAAAELGGRDPAALSWTLHAGGDVALWQLPNLFFTKLSNASSNVSLKTKYANDGHLLLLRDDSLPVLKLSEAQAAAINPHRGTSYGGWSILTPSPAPAYRRRETGVKIGVRNEHRGEGKGEEEVAPAAAAPTHSAAGAGSAAIVPGTGGKSEEDLMREAATRVRLREEAETAAAEMGDEPIVGEWGSVLDGFD